MYKFQWMKQCNLSQGWVSCLEIYCGCFHGSVRVISCSSAKSWILHRLPYHFPPIPFSADNLWIDHQKKHLNTKWEQCYAIGKICLDCLKYVFFCVFYPGGRYFSFHGRLKHWSIETTWLMIKYTCNCVNNINIH